LTLDSSITIRAATRADIPALLAIEQQTPTSAHWSENQYDSCFCGEHSRRVVQVAESNPSGGIVGFLIAHHIPPEWELENIAIAQTVQRNGLGKQLLSALIHEAKQTQSEALFLEVRESNAAARAFYEKTGFRRIGLRKSYYSNPQENAIRYRLALR